MDVGKSACGENSAQPITNGQHTPAKTSHIGRRLFGTDHFDSKMKM